MRGKRRAISTSKIRKITAIKKNRRENGLREDEFGSNPHSNGELFSRSEISFFERMDASLMIIKARIIKILVVKKRENIIYSEFSDHLIGSQAYYYTK